MSTKKTPHTCLNCGSENTFLSTAGQLFYRPGHATSVNSSSLASAIVYIGAFLSNKVTFSLVIIIFGLFYGYDAVS